MNVNGSLRYQVERNPFSTCCVRPGALAYVFELPSATATEANDIAGNSRFANGEFRRAVINRICDRLTAAGSGCIVGPHGSGKSTLIEDLLPTLRSRFAQLDRVKLCAPPADPVTRLPRLLGRPLIVRRHHRQASATVSASLSDRGPGSLLVIDGIEQLNGWGRRRILRQAARRRSAVLATSHRRLPGLPVIFRTRLFPELITHLTGELLYDASPAIRRAVTDELASRDLTKLENLREFWFELYDVAESSRSCG